MKLSYLLILFTTLLSGATACHKILDVPGNAGPQVVTSQIFTDSTNATAGVITLYQTNAVSPLTSGNLLYYTALSGDEGKSTDEAFLTVDQDFDMEVVSPGTNIKAGDAANLWSYTYGSIGIFGANAAIEGINANHDSSLPASVRTELIGECKLVRAYHYFNLVNLFGDVPLVLSTNWKTTSLLPRTPSDAVYDQIVQDLKDAQAGLPAAYITTGRQRPNAYTAMALLARVYLYRKQWDLAKAMADSVIGSGMYSLEANLDNVFLDNSVEAIWELGCTNTAYPNAAPAMQPFIFSSTIIPPNMVLSGSAQKAFETGDQRQAHWTQPLTVIDYSTFTISKVLAQYKFKNTYTNTFTAAAEDLVIIRLAELYLIRAEVRARLGDVSGAMQDVNILRQRAGLAPVTAASLSEALGIVLHERQVELFFEGPHRWYDLKRMDSVNAVLSRVKPAYWPADGHAALYPISEPEILNNPNLTQNPGY